MMMGPTESINNSQHFRFSYKAVKQKPYNKSPLTAFIISLKEITRTYEIVKSLFKILNM